MFFSFLSLDCHWMRGVDLSLSLFILYDIKKIVFSPKNYYRDTLEYVGLPEA